MDTRISTERIDTVKTKEILAILLGIAVSLTLTACIGMSPKKVSVPEYALQVPVNSYLSRQFEQSIKKNPGLSGFHLLDNGQDTLSLVSYLIDHSERTLDLQYFIFHNDKTGKLVAYKLLKAADRGVKIRILLDDMFAISQEDFLDALNAHPNISVKLYNRLSKKKWLRAVNFLTDFARVNRRMHNKAFIVDNQLAIVGGRNIGDAYYTAKIKYLFSDLDVVSVGPIVPEISQSFDEYWNAKWAAKLPTYDSKYLKEIMADIMIDIKENYKTVMGSVYGRSLRKLRVGHDLVSGKTPLIWASYNVLYDPPSKVGGLKKKNINFVESRIIEYTRYAQDEVSVVSPYFIPSRFGMGWIKKLRRNSIKISLVTNSFASNDTPVAHGGYKRYRKRLLKRGVSLFEFKPDAFSIERSDNAVWYKKELPRSSLHSKALLIDDKYVFIGSVNLSPRSRYMNTEIVIVIYGPQMAKKIKNLFNIYKDPKNSYQVVLRKRKSDDFDLETPENEIVWLTQEKGKSVEYYQEPDVWLLKKLGISILSFLPIEGLL